MLTKNKYLYSLHYVLKHKFIQYLKLTLNFSHKVPEICSKNKLTLRERNYKQKHIPVDISL